MDWRKIREFGVPDKIGNQSLWAVTHTVAFCSHSKDQSGNSTNDCLLPEHTENIPVVKAKKSLKFVSKYSLLVILEWEGVHWRFDFEQTNIPHATRLYSAPLTASLSKIKLILSSIFQCCLFVSWNTMPHTILLHPYYCCLWKHP